MKLKDVRKLTSLDTVLQALKGEIYNFFRRVAYLALFSACFLAYSPIASAL